MSTETPAKQILRLLAELTPLIEKMAAETAIPQQVQTPSNAKKLSKREVAKIRELSRLGAKNVDIAYGYDINPATVSRIVRGIYFK